MYESSKTAEIRGEAFIEKYLRGRVIDIGSGNDLVCPNAEGFDLEDGNANYITRFRQENTYDTVHSSHCLEHMHNPKWSLLEWWKLIKPGGYLILVVPDEDLYEQGFWPSIFNGDHKNTFTLKNEKSSSPVSHNIYDLVLQLPHSEVISAEVQDRGYDYKYKHSNTIKALNKTPIWFRIFRKLSYKYKFLDSLLERFQKELFISHQIPFDQTMRNAVAQIQVVARKIR